MNRYLIYITGSDNIGYSFAQNLVTYANKGATLLEDKVPSMRFPYSAWMFLATKEKLKNEPGVQIQIIEEKLTKEELEAFDWETFKAKVKKAGVSGRDRQLMTTKYLKATDQEE